MYRKSILTPTPPSIVTGNSEGMGGQFVKGMYEATLRNPGGRGGCKPNSHPWWWCGYFVEPHNGNGCFLGNCST